MTRVLLVDDDVELCHLLREYLEGEGFEVDVVHDGEAAARVAAAQAHDIMVLDVMMPNKNGFDVLRDLRAESNLPVLMLTARGEDVDRIVGLEIGADDYLVKPCNPRELAARLRAILRRTSEFPATGGGSGDPDPGAANERIEANGTCLIPSQRNVFQDGEPVNLTSTEFTVLEVLVRQAGLVVSKGTLSEQALGRKLTPFDRSIDMHVSNLRKKLGPDPGGEQRIKTVRNVGYLFVA